MILWISVVSSLTGVHEVGSTRHLGIVCQGMCFNNNMDML